MLNLLGTQQLSIASSSSKILRVLHQQLLSTLENPETKAETKSLQISLKTTEDTMVEMEIAYEKQAKGLTQAKVERTLIEHNVLHLRSQLGKDDTK